MQVLFAERERPTLDVERELPSRSDLEQHRQLVIVGAEVAHLDEQLHILAGREFRHFGRDREHALVDDQMLLELPGRRLALVGPVLNLQLHLRRVAQTEGGAELAHVAHEHVERHGRVAGQRGRHHHIDHRQRRLKRRNVAHARGAL